MMFGSKFRINHKFIRQSLFLLPCVPKVQVIGPSIIESQDLDLLKQWVELNSNLILEYWEGQIEDTFAVISSMKPLPS
jgi:hypothetical protein